MMTHLGTTIAGDTIESPELEILDLAPDVVALIDEIDAILCAALAPVRRPPAPPVTGCALLSSGRLAGPVVRWSALGRRPVQPVSAVRAVQRGPPNRSPRSSPAISVKGR